MSQTNGSNITGTDGVKASRKASQGIEQTEAVDFTLEVEDARVVSNVELPDGNRELTFELPRFRNRYVTTGPDGKPIEHSQPAYLTGDSLENAQLVMTCGPQQRFRCYSLSTKGKRDLLTGDPKQIAEVTSQRPPEQVSEIMKELFKQLPATQIQEILTGLQSSSNGKTKP